MQPPFLCVRATNRVSAAGLKKGSFTNTNDSGDTEANSVGSDDLDALIAGIDVLYRPGAKFMMHVKTIDKLRGLKDRYGHPLWAAGLSSAAPDTILGYPYEWNNVGGVTMVRYNELYMPNHQIGFQAFLRTDSRRLQQSAFALLYNPLS